MSTTENLPRQRWRRAFGTGRARFILDAKKKKGKKKRRRTVSSEQRLFLGVAGSLCARGRKASDEGRGGKEETFSRHRCSVGGDEEIATLLVALERRRKVIAGGSKLHSLEWPEKKGRAGAPVAFRGGERKGKRGFVI